MRAFFLKNSKPSKEASRAMTVVRRSSFSSFLFLCFPLLATFCQTSDAVGSAMIEAINCSTSGNYTPAGAYAANLNQFLAALPENAVSKNGGFFNGTVGDGKATVYGLGMCSADYSRADCGDCLAATAGSNNGGLPNRCPGSTTVLAVFDKCLVRYSDTNFLGTAETDVIYSSGGATPSSSSMAYSGKMKDRLQLLTGEAVTSPQRFAASATDPPYALMQCTWDLAPDKCKQCLDVLSANASNWWTMTIEGKRKSYSCTVRYSNTSFMVLPFNGASSPTSSVDQTAASAAALSSQRSRTVGMVVGSVLAIVLAALLGYLLWRVYRSRCLPKTQVDVEEHMAQSQTLTTQGMATKDVVEHMAQSQTLTTQVDVVEHMAQSQTSTVDAFVPKAFTYEELKNATSNFLEAKRLGQGCFGDVYEGRLPDIAENVAIKRILETSSPQAKRAFRSEITIMRQLCHRNILRLLGWCEEDDHLLLIYEKMTMGSLDNYLYPRHGITDVEVSIGADGSQLDWPRRRNIIVGIASGLAYLHTGNRKNAIVHRDIKPGNILLDKNFNARLADFGLVTQFSHSQTSHRTDYVIGTREYIDPTYKDNGKANGQCDVYSFGVMLLEIASGIKPTMSDDDKLNMLVEDMVQKDQNQDWDHILNKYPQTFHLEIKNVLKIGLMCVRSDRGRRPHIGKVDADLKSTMLMRTSSSTSASNPSPSRANERGSAASISNNRQPSEVEFDRLPANSNSRADEEAGVVSLLQRSTM